MYNAESGNGGLIWRLAAFCAFMLTAALVAYVQRPWVEMRLYCFAVLPSITVQTMGFAFESIQSRVFAERGDAPVARNQNWRVIPTAAVFGAFYMWSVSLLVMFWPVTPNVRIVYPLKGVEVSPREMIAGSFAQISPDRDLWVDVVTQEVDPVTRQLAHNHYFSSVVLHRNEGTWETRQKVGIGRESGKGDEGANYTVVLYLSDPEVSRQLRNLGADTGQGISERDVPHALTRLQESDFRRRAM